MNILWNIGEMGVGWAFPQVGATLSTYRWVKTAYRVAKSGSAFFSGDVVSGLRAAAQSMGTCEEIRTKCVEAATSGKIYCPDDAKTIGWKTAACWASYWICKFTS